MTKITRAYRHTGEQVYRVWKNGLCFGEFIDKEGAENYIKRHGIKHKQIVQVYTELGSIPVKNWRENRKSLKKYNSEVCELQKNGVKYFVGQGFFQVVYEDKRTFQVCYDTEDGCIDLSNLGEDWGICGTINADFDGDILQETKKHAKIMRVKTKGGGE